MSEKVVKLYCTIDDRERDLIELFNQKKRENKNSRVIMEYESKRLDIADVVVSTKVGIERKEGFDFAASIKDNRLPEQLERLRQSYTSPVLIVEGLNDKVFDTCNLHINSIYSNLAKYSYQLGIATIQTRTLYDTSIVIERIAYREQIKKGHTLLARSCPKGMTEEERRAYMLEGLIDCGPKKAKLLIKHFGTPFNVINAIRLTSIEYTRTGNPKGIKGVIKDAGLSGFGWRFIKANKKLICDIDDMFINDTAPTISKKAKQLTF